ncbi:MAG: hypothetical protein JWQ55_6238, partial [Rhodopila sp.]|nr:hypothetical protein [Rhodopila sp.]
VPADFLIAAGVSHWGAYAMLAALAVLPQVYHADQKREAGEAGDPCPEKSARAFHQIR